MAATPLKTASRALSIATVLMAGFAAWVLGMQGLPPREESSEPPGASSPNVSFAPVVKSSSSDQPKDLLPAAASRRRPDADLVQAEPKPLVVNESYFGKDRTADRSVDVNTSPSVSPKTDVPTRRPQPRIQPELGRFSDRDQESVVRDPQNAADLLADEPLRAPRTTRANSRPAAVFRPVDVAPETGTSRVESRLTALQHKLDQLAQVQSDQKTADQERTLEALQLLQQQKQSENNIEKLLKELLDSQPKEGGDGSGLDPKLLETLRQKLKTDAAREKPAAETVPELPAESTPPASKKPGFLRIEPTEGQSDRFDNIEFDEVDISRALAMLGQLSGMNILIGRGVTGQVPAANLQNVTAEEALDAITKSLGYVYEREGNFVFVWTAADALARKQAARKLVSKVYRPKYISVRELQMLVTPMLTKPGGLIAVTRPAEIGLEESRTKVGGDNMAQTDAILIIDYPEVIAQLDLIIDDIDVSPSQVVIEAMILSVKLTDSMKMGVNFALLNGKNKQLVTTGNGAQINGNVGFPNNPLPNKSSLLPVAGDFIANTAGLKYGFLYGDLAGFVEALETLAETSVVASPSLRVLNKQKAELIIGSRLGYKTTTFNGTQSIENINFLEVGTKLLLRPFVTPDGLVRMEIHPERSDGTISDAGLPSSRTTEVTSNVMVRDGSTIVVGGLIEEQANQSQSRVPGLGALPVVGNLFKNKTNDTTRTELIVLITPRIIHDPDAECEGEMSRSENERRHQEYRDKLSPINRHNLARIEYERAARYFEEGDVPRAKRHIDESLRHNRLDNDALRLRDQIAAALNDKNWWKKLRRKPPTPYHNVPSAPTSLPNGEAIFELETPASPSLTPPVPSAPAASPDEPTTSPPSAARNSNGRSSRS